jgi:hypothetical protein
MANARNIQKCKSIYKFKIGIEPNKGPNKLFAEKEVNTSGELESPKP